MLSALALVMLILAKIAPRTETVWHGPMHAVDGDTLSASGKRLRIKGIDAPELVQTCQRAAGIWACGMDARSKMAGFAASTELVCSSLRLDKYRRPLVTCTILGQDIGRAMVLSGLAVGYQSYDSEERQAEAAGLGLWAGTFVRPIDWRRSHKNHKAGMMEDDLPDPAGDMIADVVDWFGSLFMGQ